MLHMLGTILGSQKLHSWAQGAGGLETNQVIMKQCEKGGASMDACSKV